MARAGFWIVGVAVGLLFLKEMLGQYGSRGDGPSSWVHPRPLPLALADRHLQVGDSFTVAVRPRAGAFDSMYVADIAITNRSTSAVHDIALSCDAMSASGEATGHTSTMLELPFPARTTTTAPNVELRFVHKPVSARCAVRNFTIGQ
jgi:hypothetical protein